MPLAAPGNGILFADRNGDGVANDGAELFGPSSGDGFGELARQDAARNGLLGQIRASGIHLREDGQAGFLQQVDLAV